MTIPDKVLANHELVVSRRAVLTGMTALAALPASAGQAGESIMARPNIIFIMADDLGYADLSCYGARSIRTPHIDRIAAEGIRLSDGYSNSAVCSATRTALITGRYQYRFRCGLEEPIGFDNIGLPSDVPTLPAMLRASGYRTSLVGKWHLGDLPDYGPLKSGYDHFFGIQAGGADYFTHRMSYRSALSSGLVEGETPIERHGYLTDLLGQRAIEEVELAASEGRPLFLSLHFTAPHWPWEGPEDEALSKTVANSMHTDGGSLATYAAMVENMDANIGRLLERIDQLGLSGDTIVVFTSDNGGERFSDCWPFIGAKTELLEGGIRVPIIIRWPGHIEPGSESCQVMISMDFVPTLLAAAGIDVGTDFALDGENLLDVLTGAQAARPRTLFWRYKAGEQAAVRDGCWKYLKIKGREHLFNLAEDQHERADLRFKEPDRFIELKANFSAWNATMLPYPASSNAHSISDLMADRYELDGPVKANAPD